MKPDLRHCRQASGVTLEIFTNKTLETYFWHLDEFTEWAGHITYIQLAPSADLLPLNKEMGASVRCIKD